MGDILMSSPAIKALKSTFNCHITLLTSNMGNPITRFIPCIDDVMIFDLPWVKTTIIPDNNSLSLYIAEIKKRNFDAAIIFNVYSQNPLPSVMIAYMAGIPLRLAYCRENPYGLLTDWLPDKEPFSYIVHQVKRDLALVESIGAKSSDNALTLQLKNANWSLLQLKLKEIGIDLNKKWLIAHAGVSEQKRSYPNENWIILAKEIVAKLNYQVLFTGAQSEINLTEYLAEQVGDNAFSLSGKLNMEEFLLIIKNSPLVISVNTITIHIAAATKTPIVVLYALTNPQHLPWKAKGKVLSYLVPSQLSSKNEIIKYVSKYFHPDVPEMQLPANIFKSVEEILIYNKIEDIPEMFMPKMQRVN